MTIDILQLLCDESITEDEAYDLFEAAINEFHELGGDQIDKRVGLTPNEWQANAHGVDLAQLAKWRRDGWPKSCSLCGEALDLDEEYWFADSRPVNGQHQIKHAACSHAVFEAIRMSLQRELEEEESLQIVGPSAEYPRGYWVRFDGENRPMDSATDKAIEDSSDPVSIERTRVPLPPWKDRLSWWEEYLKQVG